MKILILTNNASGLYQFRKELIVELQKEAQITVSLPYEEMAESLKKMGCEFIETKIDRRGVNPIKDLTLLRTYFRILKQVQPDLVVTYTIKPNVYGGLACRIRKIPYAVNVTGLGSAFQNPGLLRKLVTVLYKAGVKGAKTVFFENEENKEFFLKAGIVKEQPCCLMHGAGVNLEHYSFMEYPQEQEPVRFLFIGRIMKEKGIDELLEAMKRLRKEEFACTLDILGRYEEDYDTLIRTYENEGWLKFHGYQKDIRPFVEQSHCVVLPSWHEGMANVNLECAASGRPVITSRICGCKEAVIENVSGYLCERRDTDSLYEEMKKFIQLPYDEKKAMGIAGRKHMEAVFDKNKVVKETIEGLKRV